MTAWAPLLAAERIKLSTTRTPRRAAVAVAVVGVGAAMLAASGSSGSAPTTPGEALLGLAVVGVPVLTVVAALSVTGEYRTGLVRTSLTAMPARGPLLAAKALVAVAYAAVVTLAVGVVGLLAARGTVGSSAGGELSLAGAAAWRVLGAVVFSAVCAAVLAVGLGALVRHSAGAVTVLLLEPFVVEPVLALLPDTSEAFGPLLLFRNALYGAGVPWLFVDAGLWWGPAGALVYVAAVCAAVFAVGAVAFARRDA